MRSPATTSLLLVFALLPRLATADVDHVVIEHREPVDGGRAFGAAGAYERISGKISFSFDPKNPANARVVDLDHAPRDGRGLVEAWADFVVLRPVNPALGNGFALVEVVNRGRTIAPDAFDRCSAGAACRSARDVGDGFLLRHGYTVIWVGWQWDVSPHPPAGLTLLALHAPSAGDSIMGLVRTDWTIEDSTRVRPLGHGEVASRAYPVTSLDDTTAVLTVRDGPLDERRIVPRAAWSFAGEDSGRVVPDPTFLRLAAGFQVGKIYELIYPARDPVIVGLGFLVIRDVASYAKYDPRSEFRVRRVIGFGVSQSGRLLRQYLYEGFNTDEHGRGALDGVFADVAGAGRGSFNYRFAGPSRDATTFNTFFFPVDQFPFTSRVERDRVTGAADGLLENPRAALHLPKVMQVNGGYEYWARGASLIHTDVAGTTDLPPIPNERLYAIASASHLFAEVPAPVASSIPGSRSLRGDPLDQRFALRALLEALRGWISGREPPRSRYPRIADGTLVPIDEVRFPTFDVVRRPNAGLVPRRIDYGPRWGQGIIDRAPPVLGEPYRVLVPQVDSVGNDRGGVPSVETLAPLATYAGWQLRPGFPSAPDQLAAYTGSFIPLFRTEAERKAAADPRPSIERLYPNRSAYRRAVAAAVRTLIQARFLLPEDSTLVSARADSGWAWIESRNRTTARAAPLAPREGYVPVPGGRVWYQVVGSGSGTPLLVIHGGPGGLSCRLAALKVLGNDRPVIFYDQLGTGRSDRPTDTTLWRLPRFLKEIDSIRVHLRLTQVHLYGHSWGATIAAEYFLRERAGGVRSITLAGPLLSTSRWIQDADSLRAQLPPELQRLLSKHEAAGTIEAPEYRAATDSFYARYLSRRRPAIKYPECEGVEGNGDIYRYMWGPTEFHATGTLRGYDVTTRLGEFDRPVLLLAGEFDEARPQTVREFQRMIPGARFEVIPNAGHAITVDEPDRVIAIVRRFLREVDAR